MAPKKLGDHPVIQNIKFSRKRLCSTLLVANIVATINTVFGICTMEDIRSEDDWSEDNWSEHNMGG
jgi:hypothetical protein